MPLNIATTHLAFALAGVQLLFVGNVCWSLLRGRPAGRNPWQVGTLEWLMPSPPGASREEVAAVRRGPHEVGRRDAESELGRDWLSQVEAEPGEGDA